MQKLSRLPSSFTPTEPPRAICPRCWSRPDLDWGKGRALGEREMRGWGVGRPARITAGDEEVTATTAVHRCANRSCATAIEVTARLGGGWIDAFVSAHRLRGDDAARYLRGAHGPDGVWRARDGEPLTAPEQRDLFAR